MPTEPVKHISIRLLFGYTLQIRLLRGFRYKKVMLERHNKDGDLFYIETTEKTYEK